MILWLTQIGPIERPPHFECSSGGLPQSRTMLWLDFQSIWVRAASVLLEVLKVNEISTASNLVGYIYWCVYQPIYCFWFAVRSSAKVLSGKINFSDCDCFILSYCPTLGITYFITCLLTEFLFTICSLRGLFVENFCYSSAVYAMLCYRSALNHNFWEFFAAARLLYNRVSDCNG